MKDEKIFVKGVSSGVVFAFLLEIAVAVQFIKPIGAFMTGVISAIALSIILADYRPKYIFFQILIAIIPAFMTLGILLKLNIVDQAFHYQMGEDVSMTGGDGLGIIAATFQYIIFTVFAPFIAYYIGKKRNGK